MHSTGELWWTTVSELGNEVFSVSGLMRIYITDSDGHDLAYGKYQRFGQDVVLWYPLKRSRIAPVFVAAILYRRD